MVMPHVKEHLYSCFTDERGRFNEELYHKRVFYVNAYGTLCAKTGKNERAFLGGRWLEFPVDIESTGMPLYEKTQNEFINSDERYNNLLMSAVNLMADQLEKAEKSIQNKLNSVTLIDDKRKKAEESKKIGILQKLVLDMHIKIEEMFFNNI